MRKTLFEVLQERFKKKPTTAEEINQLKLDLEKENIKAKIREIKNKNNGDKLAKFNDMVKTLCGDGHNKINI